MATDWPNYMQLGLHGAKYEISLSNAHRKFFILLRFLNIPIFQGLFIHLVIFINVKIISLKMRKFLSNSVILKGIE